MMNVLIVLVSLITTLLIYHPSHAQGTSPLVVSWRANAYAPGRFEGKILASRNGSITASVDLLIAGKPADLARREIRWFVNNELYRSGKNLKRVTLQAPIQSSDEMILKVVVLGSGGGSNIERLITIPIASPEVVLDVPSAGGYIPAASIETRAIPYFFSVDDPNELSYEWTANGSRAENESGSGSVITLDATSGTPESSVILGVRAINPAALIESAQASLMLRIR
ncbi:MAG: hypothetical protein AAB518_00235 [Patescibacteria group bacterium]